MYELLFIYTTMDFMCECEDYVLILIAPITLYLGDRPWGLWLCIRYCVRLRLLIEKLSFITAYAVAKIPNNVTKNKLLWDFDMGKYHVNIVCIK